MSVSHAIVPSIGSAGNAPGEIARDGRCRADVDRMPMEAAMIERTRQQVEAPEMSERYTVSDGKLVLSIEEAEG
jgi:hypothetical protein